MMVKITIKIVIIIILILILNNYKLHFKMGL